MEVRLSSSVVIGTDEEKGLAKAVRDVFRESTHLLCVKHLRDNVVDYMRNKCGVQQSVRNRLVAKMFDNGGLINADVLLLCLLHTHTHPFNGPLSGTTRVSQYTRKVKPIWILVKQETVSGSGSGIGWTICKSAPRCRQITTPTPHCSVFYRPDALPAAQPTASKH